MGKRISMILNIILSVMLFSVWQVYAGDPAGPNTPPASTSSYTLEDIYNRLDAGTTASQSNFTEPSVAPGTGTMHTLNDIYDLIGERAGVPKTGQTICYDAAGAEINCTGTGQDGEYQAGVTSPSPRFTDNGDGSVTDNLTGLIWLKDANCFGQQNWTSALSSANSLASGNCGLTDGSAAGDWRLPNPRELYSLIDYGQASPLLPSGHPFTSVQGGYYWSSSTNTNAPMEAWYVALTDGLVYNDNKGNMFSVWAVRGGQ